MRDTNYTILFSDVRNNTTQAGDANSQLIQPITTSSFTVYVNDNTNNMCYWTVMGYLAEGEY